MIRIFLAVGMLLASAGLTSAAASEKDNVALMQKMYDDVVNGGHLENINNYISEDFVEHQPFPGQKPGREGVKEFFAMLYKAFPDVHFDVAFMMADGDKVAAYATVRGTQEGEFMGIPATGKKIEMDLVDIVRIVDGKAVEHWGVSDTMTMMQQLGVTPAPPAKP